MEINADVVKKVAKVARLDLTQSEIDKFTPQLKEILNSFSLLDEIDTSDISMSIQPVPLKDSLRQDIVKPSLSVEEVLFNTHHKKENYFKGPRAI